MARQEFPVVRIEATEISKIGGSTKQGGFHVPIRYVLADGRVIASNYRASKKKDVTAYLAKLPMEPREMAVTLTERGTVESTIQSLSGMMGW